MSRTMPPEWAPHSATWMAFPTGAYSGAGVSDDEVFTAWSAVANTIIDHEPVHMLCSTQHLKRAQRLLSSAVELEPYDINDAWLRDTGPTWVIDDNELVAVNWQFNGWGAHTDLNWDRDAGIALWIASRCHHNVSNSVLTNEGGGFHVNGQGTVLLTETVQLDPERNPQWSREQVTAEIHRQLGTDTAIWLPRGLYRDYGAHGTRGHVDIVACFTPQNTVLLHQQTATDHPDHQLFSVLRDLLCDHAQTVQALPAPKVLRDNRGWVDYSYINHYVCKDAVIMPSFADPMDDAAADVLAEAYQGREIRPIDSRVIFAMGGGVHCITQQQPELLS